MNTVAVILKSKPIKRLLLFTLFLNAVILESYAQSDFQSGYVVALNGDTIPGLIEYKGWDRSPRKILFKKSKESRANEYQPIDIKSFSVATEIYESAIVDVDTSPYKLRDLDESSLPSYIKDSVFLQSLIRGEKNLLHLKDLSGKNHYYIFDDNRYQPLIYKQYARRTEKSSKVIGENNAYRGTLALYLKDCAGIQDKLKNASYHAASLIKMFQHFYMCTNSPLQYKNERREGRLEMGILGGATMTKLDFSGPVNSLTKIEYKSSVTPTFGFFCDIRLLRTKGWRISNDILYTTFSAEGDTYIEDFPDYTIKSSFNYHHIKTHHTLQVSLLGKGKVYLSGGFSTGIALKREAEVLIAYETGTISDREFESRNYEFGYLLGLGFRAGNLHAELRFEQTSGISNYLNESSSLLRGHFLVRYSLFKP